MERSRGSFKVLLSFMGVSTFLIPLGYTHATTIASQLEANVVFPHSNGHGVIQTFDSSKTWNFPWPAGYTLPVAIPTIAFWPVNEDGSNESCSNISGGGLQATNGNDNWPFASSAQTSGDGSCTASLYGGGPPASSTIAYLYWYAPNNSTGGARGSANPITATGEMFSGFSVWLGEGDIAYQLCDSGGCDQSFSPYHLETGNITSSTTWAGHRVYKVSGNVTIDYGATLNIEPGAIIKFDTSTTSGITVNGTLNVDGDRNTDKNNQIAFTSLKDDLIGNDTNEDGNGTIATTSDWAGITVNSGGVANFAYSLLRYAGIGSGALVYNNGGTVSIASSTLAYSGSYGVKNSGGACTMTSDDLGFNSYGLYVDGGTASLTATSTIHDNDLYGVFNSTITDVDATGNYWATSTGPSSLYGSAISSHVDASSPISRLHYRNSDNVNFDCVSDNSCWSVHNAYLIWANSTTTPTTYTTELNNALSTWNDLNINSGDVAIEEATTTYYDVVISNYNRADWAFKGQWNNPDGNPSNTIQLNTYFLDVESSDYRQNTITHELGHSLGLDHSYTGNIMYANQSNQTILGPQDISDYYSIWP